MEMRTAKAISDKADVYYGQQKEKIAETTSLALDGGLPDSDVELPG